MVPPWVLREFGRESSTFLCLLFNKSLESGKIPQDWKRAVVTAIFKRGSKSEPGNYRPVSLTCVASKVLESFVRDAIVTHLTDNRLYAECQYGFRKKRSCITKLLEVMEDFSLWLNDGKPIDVIYPDFKKAFDSVSHGRQLTKLDLYGTSDKIFEWVQIFSRKDHRK